MGRLTFPVFVNISFGGNMIKLTLDQDKVFAMNSWRKAMCSQGYPIVTRLACNKCFSRICSLLSSDIISDLCRHPIVDSVSNFLFLVFFWSDLRYIFIRYHVSSPAASNCRFNFIFSISCLFVRIREAPCKDIARGQTIESQLHIISLIANLADRSKGCRFSLIFSISCFFPLSDISLWPLKKSRILETVC